MKSPNMGPNDVHLVVNARGEKMKCFVKGEADPRWVLPAHCYGSDGAAINYDVQGGDTPPGLYLCGKPEKIPVTDPEMAAYGWWFVDLAEQENQEASRGRAGIGLHGGGSALANPWAPFQGWAVTQGCVRMQNADLDKAVNSIQFAQKNGGKAWLTVDWS